MYRIQVNGEVELLSLLSAAEIRSIGAEIMLTWGGETLASITHPKVRCPWFFIKTCGKNPYLNIAGYDGSSNNVIQ